VLRFSMGYQSCVKAENYEGHPPSNKHFWTFNFYSA
jgi:hypothetical protein